MSVAGSELALVQEFDRLSRHLVGKAGTAYQAQTYLAFHLQAPIEPRSGFDRLLLGLSGSGFGLMLADSYSGLLARTSVVRKRLMLALAVLESSPPSYAVLDAPEPGGILVYVRMGFRVGLSLLTLLLGAPLLAPAQMLLSKRA